jgi:inner membrane protein
MDGQTHAALGAATALVVIRPAEPTTLIATAAVGAFAGILPDIDTGGKVAPIIHKITAAFIFIVCFFIGQAALTGSTVIESIDGSGIAVNLLGLAILIGFSIFGGTQPHRGFTHSVLALLIASFSAYLIFKNLALAFCIGYASHLLIDTVNKKGEQLLYPMPNRWCLNLCKANGLAALCTRMASYLVCIGYAAYLGLC